MQTSPETLLDDLHRLLAEEAHLISQEVQDSLNADQMRRLHELSAALDRSHELLTQRHPAR